MNNQRSQEVFIARQGDVLIQRVNDIPAGLLPVDRDQGRVILAYGEMTGHAHIILDDAVSMFAPADVDEMTDRFLRVEAECAVLHEEHDTITLAPGAYVVRRQREYTSADMPPLPVAD